VHRNNQGNNPVDLSVTIHTGFLDFDVALNVREHFAIAQLMS
jgi:hypothetical protein